MYIDDQKKILESAIKLKKLKNYKLNTLSELRRLPYLSGVNELFFKESNFYMLNINNDDAVPLKYFWRDGYENLSLELWYIITRKEGVFFDIGAHTGLYSIIGNLNKKQNQIISVEAFYMNHARLMSNLKLNKISTTNCVLGAVSNKDGFSNFHVPTSLDYHSSGGGIADKGKLKVQNIVLDNFKLQNKVCGIKVDTEGNEYNVLIGARGLLEKDKPEIIFEINKNSFEKCFNFLNKLNYMFYFLDEEKNKQEQIKKIEDRFFNKLEGANCYAKPQN